MSNPTPVNDSPADPGLDASAATFRPSFRVKLLFAGIMLLLGVAGGEIMIRLLAPQPASWLDIYVKHPDLDLYSIQPNVHRMVDSGETRWEVFSGEFGFRMAEGGSVDRKGTLCIGDSFTFGHGVNAPDTFVALLDAAKTAGSAYLNTGVPGYGPIQYRQVLEYYLSQGFSPPRVIIGVYVGNDIHDCVWKAETRVVDGILGNRGDLRSFIKRNSHGYRLLSSAYHRLYPKTNDAFAFREKMFEEEHWTSAVLKEGLERLTKEFAAIAKICADRSIPLMVVVIPIRDAVEPGGEPTATRDPNRPVAKVLAGLHSSGIRAVDITPHLKGRAKNEVYFAHDGHFTPLGNKLAFEAIRDELIRSGP